MATKSSSLMQTQTTSHRWLACMLVLLTLACLTPNSSNGQMPYGNFEDYPLDLLQRPNLLWVSDQEIIFPEGLITLWEKALDRNEPQLSRLVIDSAAIAVQRGLSDVLALEPKLIELAKRDNLDPKLAAAIANALVDFNATSQAPLLVKLATDYGPSVSSIVEPALAEWKSTELEDVWTNRLQQGVAGEAEMIYAIKGLASIKSDQASEQLQQIVSDDKRSAAIRLIAAQQLAIIDSSGLLDLAKQISATSTPNHFYTLLAIEFLGRHTDEATIAFLYGTLDIQSDAVQSHAIRNLYRINPSLVEPLGERFKSSKDANVRQHLIDALADAASKERIFELSYFLNDINPHLRRSAAAHLLKLAERPELTESVIEATAQIQSGSQWQGCEQSTWVLGKLKYLPSGARMVELLGHERGDVKVAAAWGLNELKMPEHLPAMLEHAQSVWDGFQSGQLNAIMRGITPHQALLFNAFGDLRYSAAEPLLMKYVPKNYDIGVDARVAAVWALGMLHEDAVDEKLAADLVGRLEDNGQFPEIEDVRNMSAVSLGRMRAESALDSLKRFANEGLTGCHWALERMIGQAPPPLRPNRVLLNDWFLAPVPRETDTK
jgi:HEAT repeat protein